MTKTKSDLIANLAEKQGLSPTRAEAVIETMLASMTDALRAGEGIEIRGFGSFHLKNYGAYTGRNPKTGQPIAIRAKRGVHFRVGKELLGRVAAAAPGAPSEPVLPEAPAKP